MSTKVSRRGFFKQILAFGAVPIVGGVYATQVEPFWPEIHEVEIRVKNLPASFEGFRIAHVTDMHAADIMPFSYLERVVKTVEDLKPDIVIGTGDFTTHGPKWVSPICELLATFSMPIFCSLGNHDYGLGGYYQGGPMPMAKSLEAKMAENNITLLRNQAVSIDHADGKIWIAGFEDLWSGRFAPRIGFSQVKTSDPVIALSHNPDTAEHLSEYSPALICCGHTHGGQIRLPAIGALMLPMNDKRFDMGMFQIAQSTLYVSRGVGYLRRARFLCRPEVPIYVLRNA